MLQRWGDHLYIENQNVLLKTLEATTQLAAIEPPDSTQTLRQHEKRRLYAFKFRRINDILCIDNFESKIRSVRGFKYVIIMVLRKSRFTKAYPTKHKSDILDRLRRFMTDIGIPEKICADCAKEYVLDLDFLGELRQYKIRVYWSEPHHQHQNLAEGRVRDKKRTEL